MVLTCEDFWKLPRRSCRSRYSQQQDAVDEKMGTTVGNIQQKYLEQIMQMRATTMRTRYKAGKGQKLTAEETLKHTNWDGY